VLLELQLVAALEQHRQTLSAAKHRRRVLLPGTELAAQYLGRQIAGGPDRQLGPQTAQLPRERHPSGLGAGSRGHEQRDLLEHRPLSHQPDETLPQKPGLAAAGNADQEQRATAVADDLCRLRGGGDWLAHPV
jgi:hypothetical protein